MTTEDRASVNDRTPICATLTPGHINSVHKRSRNLIDSNIPTGLPTSEKKNYRDNFDGHESPMRKLVNKHSDKKYFNNGDEEMDRLKR